MPSVEHPIALEPVQAYSQKMKNILTPSYSTTLRAARRFAALIAACGSLGILAGCASEPESHQVSSLPPAAPTRSVTTTTTTTTPDSIPGVAVVSPANVIVTTATPLAGTTFVTQAPPALQTEVVLAQPYPNYVWVPGYWSWSSRQQYQWTTGHWTMPPNSSAVWVAPRWEQQGNGYKFTEGYWN